MFKLRPRRARRGAFLFARRGRGFFFYGRLTLLRARAGTTRARVQIARRQARAACASSARRPLRPCLASSSARAERIARSSASAYWMSSAATVAESVDGAMKVARGSGIYLPRRLPPFR
jgi:hypothetical protein